MSDRPIRLTEGGHIATGAQLVKATSTYPGGTNAEVTNPTRTILDNGLIYVTQPIPERLLEHISGFLGYFADMDGSLIGFNEIGNE